MYNWIFGNIFCAYKYLSNVVFNLLNILYYIILHKKCLKNYEFRVKLNYFCL